MSPATVPAANHADANVAIVRRLMEEGFSEGNLDVIEELIGPDCVEHRRGTGPGAAGVRRVVAALHSWFAGFGLEIQDLVSHGGTVWIRKRDRNEYRPLPGIRAHQRADRHHGARRRRYRGRAGRRALGRRGSTGGGAAAWPARPAWLARTLTRTAARPGQVVPAPCRNRLLRACPGHVRAEVGYNA